MRKQKKYFSLPMDLESSEHSIQRMMRDGLVKPEDITSI